MFMSGWGLTSVLFRNGLHRTGLYKTPATHTRADLTLATFDAKQEI